MDQESGRRADESNWLRRALATLRALFTTGIGCERGAASRTPFAPGAGGYPDGPAFRDDILTRYPFTDEAARLLRTVRFEVKNLRQPVGGGGWYGPEARRVVLEGIQDEAAVHELAHAWADLAGFYRERAPDGPPWPIWHRPFRAAVKRAADDADPRYATIQFLAHQYEYGDPALNFPGMIDNDPERFAGLASGSMGDTTKMPPYLAAYYRGLFQVADEGP